MKCINRHKRSNTRAERMVTMAKIVVVDNDRSILTSLSLLLEGEVFTVQRGNDAQSACTASEPLGARFLVGLSV